MFKKILFATSAEPTCEPAAKVAFDMAKTFEAGLEVFHVMGVPTRGFGHFVHDTRTGETQVYGQDVVDKVTEELEEIYGGLMVKRPEAAIETSTGTPHMEILRRAHKTKADLIVMGAHYSGEEKGALRGVFAGSTVQMVAKSARCPLLIVARPCETCWGYFSNIVFGTDFSPQSEHAFKFALKLARGIGTKLYLFHAMEVGNQAALSSQDHIEEQLKAAEQKLQDTYVSKMGGFDLYESEVWEGTPYVEITKFARQKHADLIIMAHHTRVQEPDDAKLGTTMEQVVMRSVCPVMSVNHPERVIKP